MESLCLIKHHAIKTYWGVEVQLYAFIILALYGGEWSASRPGHFTPGVNSYGIHWIGDWVVLSAGLDAVAERGSPIIDLASNRTQVVQPIT
jgi:hypothetical protein